MYEMMKKSMDELIKQDRRTGCKISYPKDNHITNKAVPGDWRLCTSFMKVGSVVMLPNWGRCPMI